jgi:hypothetical protein
MKCLKQYIYNLLIAVDQLINAVLLGDPDETISIRLGRVCPDSYIVIALDWVFFWQTNHCHKSIEPDEGKDDLIWPRRRK